MEMTVLSRMRLPLSLVIDGAEDGPGTGLSSLVRCEGDLCLGGVPAGRGLVGFNRERGIYYVRMETGCEGLAPEDLADAPVDLELAYGRASCTPDGLGNVTGGTIFSLEPWYDEDGFILCLDGLLVARGQAVIADGLIAMHVHDLVEGAESLQFLAGNSDGSLPGYVVMARRRITLGELPDLAPGAVIPVDTPGGILRELVFSGSARFRGELVGHDGAQGFMVLDLCEGDDGREEDDGGPGEPDIDEAFPDNGEETGLREDLDEGVCPDELDEIRIIDDTDAPAGGARRSRSRGPAVMSMDEIDDLLGELSDIVVPPAGTDYRTEPPFTRENLMTLARVMRRCLHLAARSVGRELMQNAAFSIDRASVAPFADFPDRATGARDATVWSIDMDPLKGPIFAAIDPGGVISRRTARRIDGRSDEYVARAIAASLPGGWERIAPVRPGWPSERPGALAEVPPGARAALLEVIAQVGDASSVILLAIPLAVLAPVAGLLTAHRFEDAGPGGGTGKD